MTNEIKIVTGNLGDARYELKFCFRETAIELLESWIRTSPACFHKAYPSRQVNNIYFDTLDRNNVEENLAGALERTKIRLRWYGELSQFKSSILEMKIKQGEMGWKAQAPVDGKMELSSITWAEVLSNIRSSNLGEITPHFQHTQTPSIINSYQRSYFISGDGEVRITLDSDLNFYNQIYYSKPNIARKEPRSAMAVMEIKTSKDNCKHAIAITSDIPLYRSAFSKYLIGTTDLGFSI